MTGRSEWLDLLLLGSLALLSLALVLTLWRVVIGPSRPDRVVALELTSLLAVGLTTVYTLYTGEAMLLRPATMLALLSFLGTVGIAQYVEKHEVVK